MPDVGADRRLTLEVWRSLGGEGTPPAIELRGERGTLPGPLAVEDLLAACAGAALMAAADYEQARTGRAPVVALERERLAVAAASERHARLDGRSPGEAFHPLSAFFATADGWIRLHANYPWHRRALLKTLAVEDTAVTAAVAERPGAELEQAVVEAGGAAAVVRRQAPWQPQPPAVRLPGPAQAPRVPAHPVVLDLTRVVAGPVGTRFLAALGAEVVRIEDPRRPELPLVALDGGLGKRRLEVDLRTPEGRRRLEAMLGRADVLVDGHRPGALQRFGLSADALADRHPQLVHVSLSAWGEEGPWRTRRGFDSLVQAASGIAEAVRPAAEGRPPGALPVQALDHATGYLVAAAALRGLADRARSGHAPRLRLALAATADALLALPRTSAPPREIDPSPHLVEMGRLRVALPPGEVDGVPLAWPEVRRRRTPPAAAP